MKILIIRHGEPDYSIDSLTGKGWREAEALAPRLMKEPISDVYVSPLGRAQDTAKPYLAQSGKKIEILPWLHEFRGQARYPDGGLGLVWNQKPQFWSREALFFDKDGWLTHPFISEGTVPEIYRETQQGIETLLGKYGFSRDGYIWKCDQNPDTTIALFCHFGLGMVMLADLLGISPVVAWQSFFMPTSSVTTLITEERVKGEVFFKCMSVGDTSHLYATNEPVSHSGLYPEFFTGDENCGAQV